MSILERLLPHRSEKTMFGQADIVQTLDDDGRLVKVLKIGESLQSATYIGKKWNVPAFKYILSFDHMFEAQNESFTIKRVLMLGGGGFAYPKHVLSQRSGLTMDVVEIDPTIIKLAKEEFYLDRLIELLRMSDNFLHIHNCDGIDFVENSNRKYEVVINDSFEGEISTADFMTYSGVEKIKHLLVSEGLYMSNIVVDFTREGARGIYSFITTLESLFENVYVIDATDASFGGADNFLIIATDGEYEFSDQVPFDF